MNSIVPTYGHFNPIEWLPVKNNSGEEIPGFAVMKDTGVEDLDGQAIYVVNKPDESFQTSYLFNGPTAIPKDGYGTAKRLVPGRVLFDGAAGSYGDSYGAKDGEWKLFNDRPGFLYQGQPIDGTAMFRQIELGDDLEGFGVLTSDLAAGSPATLQVTEQSAADGSLDDPSATLTCYAPLLKTGFKLLSGWGVYFKRNGKSGKVNVITCSDCAVEAGA